jgi:hypothetical protein
MGTLATPAQVIFHRGPPAEALDWGAACACKVAIRSNEMMMEKAAFDMVDVPTESPLRVSGKKSLIGQYQK